MDGIPSGISSITPILPETVLIAERGNAGGAPVEIMPVPQDSFNRDGATAEMQNPLTLNRNGTMNDDRVAGRTPLTTPGRTPDADQAGAQLGEAYTLSLGVNGESMPPDMARELSRMKNYEQLGRVARPPYRRNPDTGAIEQAPVGQDTDESAAFLSDRMRGFSTQSPAEQSAGAAAIMEAPARETAARPAMSLAVELTPSDYEAIRSLEPDLQEALLRLIEGENIIMKPQGQAGETAGPASGGALNTADGATATGALPRLTAALTASAAAQGAVDTGMANLRKITELPYALYLFGNMDIGQHAQAEKEGAPMMVARANVQKGRAAEFLRRSEAVRMASVLHSIYHGGSGSFPQEAPWYAPYVRYAVKNGIVRSGDFNDWGEYATRSETAYIFSGSVPKAEFPVINYAPRLLDVDEDAGYGAYIYLLCRAGILMAGDRNGRFFPDSLVTRTEAAAAIGRIATPSDRKKY